MKSEKRKKKSTRKSENSNFLMLQIDCTELLLLRFLNLNLKDRQKEDYEILM